MRSKTWRKSSIKALVGAVSISMILSPLSITQANSVEALLPELTGQNNVADNGQKVETLLSEDGTQLTVKWDEATDKVDLYVDDEYTSSISMSELKTQYQQKMKQRNRFVPKSRCGHILNGVAVANGLLWAAAGVTVPAGPAALVPAVGGVVTSGIIGIAGATCKDR